jgi:hypothetical protein
MGNYAQIRSDGLVRPNDGRVDRWGKEYACQQLGGVSLFDFTTQPEARVLGEAIKWQQFLGDSDPVTILLGLDREKLTGRLIPYPQNKEGTTGNIIPWVEVCHCGPIPTSMVISYLLICPVDYARFRKVPILDEATLSLTEKEFHPVVGAERRRLASIFANQQESLRRQIRAGFKRQSSHERLRRSDQRGE